MNPIPSIRSEDPAEYSATRTNRPVTAWADDELVASACGITREAAADLLKEGFRALINSPECPTAITVAIEIDRRRLMEPLHRQDTLNNPEAVRRFLQATLQDEPNEIFGVLFLDTKNRLIRFEKVFQGTIDSSSVHPRVVVKRALDLNAAAVILVHNHPSGVADPSQADIAVTRRLQDALGLVEIRVLDHMIVGNQIILSFADNGLI